MARLCKLLRLSWVAVTEEQTPYLKAVYAKQKPHLVYDE